MGRPSVGTEEHRIVWRGSLQGMTVGHRPPLIVYITIHYRSRLSDRAQGQCQYPIFTSMTIFQLLPELRYVLFLAR
jgi:hypothetical protein